MNLDARVNPQERTVEVTTQRQTYKAGFEILSTKKSYIRAKCQGCREIRELYDSRIRMNTRGTPTVTVALCSACLATSANGKEGDHDD